MSKKSSENSSTTSTETPEPKKTTQEIIDDLRANYLPRTQPSWYLTTEQFMDLLTDVVTSLPWMEPWNEKPGHPEDVAVSVSFAVDTVSATMSALNRAGILKYTGQP